MARIEGDITPESLAAAFTEAVEHPSVPNLPVVVDVTGDYTQAALACQAIVGEQAK